MIAEATESRVYTVAEYLELEKQSEVKHEFVDGTLIEMAGESLIANEIAGNLFALLKIALRGQPYKTYFEDVKLQTKPDERYRYPDVVVRSATGRADSHTIYEAILTAEITSENSSGVDHDEKFHEYIGMPSVECYLIISQAEPLVEVYQRAGTKWEYALYTDLTAQFDITALGIALRVGDVYEGVF